MLARRQSAASPGNRWDDLRLILRKEFRGIRRMFTVLWRIPVEILFCIVLTGFLIVRIGAGHDLWLEIPISYHSYEPVRVFSTENAALVLCLAMLLPMLITAIAHEREQGTLEQLLLTPLRARDILLGKLLAALLPISIVIVFLTLVIAPGVLWTETITWNQLPSRLGPVGIFLLKVLCAGAIALWCSTYCHTVSRALAVAVPLCLLLLLPAPEDVNLHDYSVYSVSSHYQSPSVKFVFLLYFVVAAILIISWVTWATIRLVCHLTKRMPSTVFSGLLILVLTLGAIWGYFDCIIYLPNSFNYIDGLVGSSYTVVDYLPYFNAFVLLATSFTIIHLAARHLEGGRLNCQPLLHGVKSPPIYTHTPSAGKG